MRRPALTRTTLTAAALLVGLLGSGVSSAHGKKHDEAVDFRDAGRVHVVSEKRLDPRQYAVSVQSPSLGRPVDVRVLLPEGYDPDGATRYPVLYLFHGTSGRASDWVVQGSADKTLAGVPVITVMPDAGFDGNGGSWFTDWVDSGTALGPSKWETFHIDDVLPWVDANLQTVPSRAGRAIAGLSQGGFGAMTYASRHPDLFSSAASFSGAPEIARDPELAVGASVVIAGTAMGLNGTQPDAMFGNAVTNRVNWLGHDPATLVENLRATSLHIWTATGLNGEYDPEPNPGGTGIEALTHESSQRFHQHLDEAGIPSYYNDYTYGTHTWPYWTRDLQQYVPRMLRDFAHPLTPAQITYQSIDRTWTQWGWTVAVTRSAEQEFSTLSKADTAGFTLAGTGTAAVTTPAAYRPNAKLLVTVGGAPQALRAGKDGRLRITVPLTAAGTAVTIR
jgi:S-formylglutathione hydrolase FrmB